MEEKKYSDYSGSYGSKRPLWQWILIYLIIGGIIYALIYFFIINPGGNTPLY